MKISKLATVSEPMPLELLSDDQLSELQTALSLLGFPVGEIDGMIGPKTRNAWSEFKTDVFPGNPDLIGKESIDLLGSNLEALIELPNHDFSSQKGTIAAIKQECKAQGIGLDAQVAYVLATTQWETAQTFKPVREAFWLSEKWREKNFRYYPYYGRGFVQLTWETNYQKYSQLLNVDMMSDPDIAMRPNVALFILVHGFKTGSFTGRKITDYIDQNKTDFIKARRCINGSDKATAIANLAEEFLKNI